MARLARLPWFTALAGGIVALAVVVLADNVARPAQIRLVPLYVPVLCVVCWALGRWLAVLFAGIAALVALFPDIAGTAPPIGLAIAANTGIRLMSYIFLALIIVTYRRTFDAAELRAAYDGLTGVLNKMAFHDAAGRRLGGARRAGQTLLAAYVDLDGFRALNNAHGHAAGDAALRSFCGDARDAIRGSDLVGRLGGDEFGFLIAASSDHNAAALAHLIHQRFTATLAKTGLPLSCSMGALIVPPTAGEVEADLFDAADRIMRRAKAEGKDRVLIETLSGSPRDAAAA